MGMSIEKTIDFFNGLECYTPQAKDARDVAIDTMHKYQKIQEIMAKRPKDMISSNPTLRAISEVLENGNDR